MITENFVRNDSSQRFFRIFKLFLLSITFFGIFFPQQILSQDIYKLSDDYLVQHWDIRSGLPQNTINCILQTDNGFVWIGTPSGLSKYDGHRFQNFSRNNVPELKSDHISALYEDENHTLWVGTWGGGLYSFSNNIWKHYSTEQGLSNNNIRNIAGDGKGTLWVGTDYGLNRLFRNNIDIFTTRDGLDNNIITALLILNQNDIWIGTLQGGLALYDGDKFKLFGIKEGLTRRTIYHLHLDTSFNIYVATDKGVFIYDRQDNIFKYIKGTSYTPVTSVLSRDNISCYIATINDGLKIYDKTDDHLFHLDLKIQEEHITCLFKDRNGYIWIGTGSRGILQIRPSLVRTISRDEGLPENSVLCILKASTGKIFAGMRNSGVTVINENGKTHILNSNNILSGNRISALFESADHAIWIATEENGITLIDENNVNYLNQNSGLRSNSVEFIFQDSKKMIWILDASNISQYRNGKIISTQYIVHQKGEQFQMIFESKNGKILLASNYAVYSYENNKLSDALIDISSHDYEIITVYEDEDLVLWIGTNGGGLLKYSDGEMSVFKIDDGFADNYIFSIIEDEAGYMWFSSYNGIFKIKKSQLGEYSIKKRSEIFSVIYNEYSGMISRQCNGGVQPAVWKDFSGSLYYPTVMGIVKIDPDKSDYPQVPAAVEIDIITADGNQLLNIQNKIQFNYSLKSLRFKCVASELDIPGYIKYFSMLEGYEKDYRELKHEDLDNIRYNDVHPGLYRFKIYSVNAYGEKSNTLSLNIEIINSVVNIKLFLIIVLGVVLFIFMLLLYFKKRTITNVSQVKSTLYEEKFEKSVENLLQFIEKEKPYLNPDLTLKDLANKIHIHQNTLSFLINDRLKTGFNEFINSYRIKEAKRKLKDEIYNEKSVLEIMYDCGFYSKSVFNTAFKKQCGMTPSEFRKLK